MKSTSWFLFAAFSCATTLAHAQAQPGGVLPEEGEATETPPPAPTPAPTPAPAAPPAAAPPPGQYAPGWYAPPKAQASTTAPVDTAPEEPLPPAQPPRWLGSIGVRTGFVTHTGFDPFADDDALIQGSLALSRRLWMQGSLSLAAGIEFDFGTRTATARGEPTELDTQRLTVGPELRWNLIPQLYGFVRPSAGVSRSVASMEEGTSGTTLYARSWDVAVDASAGAAVAFWDLRNKNSDLRFWFVAEGGYAWTDASDLELSPDEDSGAPQRTEPLDLGELALRGPYFKLAVAASF